MKQILLVTVLLLSAKIAFSQNLYFPPLQGSTWDTQSITSLGWCQDKVDTLLNFLEEKNTKAFILLKDGKMVIEKYYGTFTKDSLWYWASAGKSLTAFTVGIAQQEGFLSINDKSSQYLGTGWTSAPLVKENLITIKNQLSMTSGLDDGVADVYCTDDTCLQYLADAGTRWAYHNGPYTLLDGVIEGATGQTLNSYITQKIKIPTGMTGSFYQAGYNNLFVSTARSMARFGLLVLNKGNWNGTQIMTDSVYFQQMVNTSQNLNLSYGYLWWLNGKSSFMVPYSQVVFPGKLNPAAPDDLIVAAGKNGQFIDIIPSQNLVFVRMGNAPDGGDVPFLLNDSIWQKLNLVMCNNVSVETIDNQGDIVVYPNPFDSKIAVLSDRKGEIWHLYNVYGEMIYEGKEIEKQDFSQLNKGLYFLRNEKKTIKLVKY